MVKSLIGASLMLLALSTSFFQEKIDALRVLGAEVFPVPAVPFDNPNNYNHQVRCIKGHSHSPLPQKCFLTLFWNNRQ